MSKRFRVTLDIEAVETETHTPAFGTVEYLARAVTEYLASPEGDLADAYGPSAYGGYDGAHIKRVRVCSVVDGIACEETATWT